MHAAWKKWLFVVGVLVATHLASAAYYYERFASGAIREGPAGALTLELTTDEWIRIACSRDPTTYLRAAENVAAGKGMTIRVPRSTPPRIEPFYYWVPGAVCLRLVAPAVRRRDDAATLWVRRAEPVGVRRLRSGDGGALDSEHRGARADGVLHRLLPAAAKLVLQLESSIVGTCRPAATERDDVRSQQGVHRLPCG